MLSQKLEQPKDDGLLEGAHRLPRIRAALGMAAHPPQERAGWDKRDPWPRVAM